jgi:hypothetical protein
MKSGGELAKAFLVVIFVIGAWYAFSEGRMALFCKRYTKSSMSFVASLFAGILAIVVFIVLCFPEALGIH